MKNFSRFSFVSLFLLLMEVSVGQSFQGRVQTADNEPIPMAVVMVIDSNDNELATAITDTLGTFTIDLSKNREGKTLYIRAFGFQMYQQSLTEVTSNAPFTLAPEAFTISEVSIKSNQLQIERDAHKFTISNIYSVPLASGNNITEVLRYAPIVNVSTDGKLGILNRGQAVIYVNGRKSNIDPTTIPAENIEKIEVIANPGSEYSAIERSVGIINIILRKSPADGVSASFTIYDSQCEKLSLNRSSLKSFITFQKNKLTASIALSLSYRPDYYRTQSQYSYWKDSLLNSLNQITQEENIYSKVNTMLDWRINDKHTLGFQFGFLVSNDFKNSTTTTNDYFRIGRLLADSSDLTISDRASIKPNYQLTGNLNYGIKFNPNQKLNFDLYYEHDYTDEPTQYQYVFNDRIDRSSSFKTRNRTSFDGLGLETNFKQDFVKDMQLTVGLDCFAEMVEDGFQRENLIGSSYFSDNMQNNQFSFKDFTEAVFVDYSWEISEKLSLSAGLRQEYYLYSGFQHVTSDVVSGKCNNFFPSLSIAFAPNDDNELDLDFTSSLLVPGYNQRNPFKRYFTPTLYQSGNQNLRPSKVYNTTLTYSLFWEYIISLDYSYTKDPWYKMNIPEEGGSTHTMDVNSGSSQDFVLTVGMDKGFFDDYLLVSASALVDYSIYNVKDELLPNNPNCFSYDAALDLSVALDKKQTLRLSTRFMFLYYTYIQSIEKPNYWLDVEISKQFTNGTLTIGASNLLNFNDREYFNSSSYSYQTTQINYGRYYWISYTMKLGNSKTKGAQQRFGDFHTNS